MQDNHFGVILEDIQSKQQLILEILVPLAQDMTVIKPKVEKLAEDMEVVKAVQKDQGRDLKQLNSRLGHVEDYLVEQGMPKRA